MNPSDEKVAVIFVGNKGTGKSTLLTQLGGSFKNGCSFVEGVTKDVEEQEVVIDGQSIILMDTPGLYEFEHDLTELNSRKLTEALKRGYYYKLFFIVSGNSRCLTPEDLCLLGRVNEAVRDVRGIKLSLWVIVNQIRGKEEYKGYVENMTRDKFQAYLNELAKKVTNFSFDIHIEDIMLLRYNERAIKNKKYYNQLKQKVMSQSAVEIVVTPIQTRPDDISVVGAAIRGFLIGAIVVGLSVLAVANPPVALAGAGVVVVVGTGAFLGKRIVRFFRGE